MQPDPYVVPTFQSSPAELGADPDVARLLDKLQALGDSQHIALHLIDCEVRGWPSSASQCAVAQYLKANLDLAPDHHVSVGNDAVHVYACETYACKTCPDTHEMVVGSSTTRIPQEVRDFIVAFDEAKFPDLLVRSAQ